MLGPGFSGKSSLFKAFHARMGSVDQYYFERGHILDIRLTNLLTLAEHCKRIFTALGTLPSGGHQLASLLATAEKFQYSDRSALTPEQIAICRLIFQDPSVLHFLSTREATTVHGGHYHRKYLATVFPPTQLPEQVTSPDTGSSQTIFSLETKEMGASKGILRDGSFQEDPERSGIFAHARTTGIVQEEVGKRLLGDQLGLDTCLVDTGGQRSERRKWMHVAPKATDILFTFRLTGYDDTLFEDDNINVFTDALELFDILFGPPPRPAQGQEGANNNNPQGESGVLRSYQQVVQAIRGPMVENVFVALTFADVFPAKLRRVPLSSYFPTFRQDADVSGADQPPPPLSGQGGPSSTSFFPGGPPPPPTSSSPSSSSSLAAAAASSPSPPLPPSGTGFKAAADQGKSSSSSSASKAGSSRGTVGGSNVAGGGGTGGDGGSGGGGEGDGGGSGGASHPPPEGVPGWDAGAQRALDWLVEHLTLRVAPAIRHKFVFVPVSNVHPVSVEALLQVMRERIGAGRPKKGQGAAAGGKGGQAASSKGKVHKGNESEQRSNTGVDRESNQGNGQKSGERVAVTQGGGGGLRDLLTHTVFPQLRSWAAARNLHLIDVDLRWGVTEEEATGMQTLNICLNEIDRARPFFISLLGHRYGWVVDDFSSLSPEPRFDPVREYAERRSVTELEHYYAAFNYPEAWTPHTSHASRPPHTPCPSPSPSSPPRLPPPAFKDPERARGTVFFYVRDPGYLATLDASLRSTFVDGDEATRAKIEALRCRVLEQFPESCFVYPCTGVTTASSTSVLHASSSSGVDDGVGEGGDRSDQGGGGEEAPPMAVGLGSLGDRVKEDLWKAICARYPEAMTSAGVGGGTRGAAGSGNDEDATWEREFELHLSFMEKKATGFVGRRALLDELAGYLEGPAAGAAKVVVGLPGSGKSALLSRMCFELAQRHQAKCDEFDAARSAAAGKGGGGGDVGLVPPPPLILVPVFVGVTPGSIDARSLLYLLCCALNRECGLLRRVPRGWSQLRDAFPALLAACVSPRGGDALASMAAAVTTPGLGDNVDRGLGGGDGGSGGRGGDGDEGGGGGNAETVESGQAPTLVVVIDALNQLSPAFSAHDLKWLPTLGLPAGGEPGEAAGPFVIAIM
eukprot:jgi/Mesvir1/4679/Mv16842-RA.1